MTRFRTGLLAWLVLVLAPYAAAVDIAIGARPAQTIDGFGTSILWYPDDPTRTPRSFFTGSGFKNLYWGDMGASGLRVEFSPLALTHNRAGRPSNFDMTVPVTLSADTYANLDLFNFDARGIGHTVELISTRQSFGGPDNPFLAASLWSPPHWMNGPELNALSPGIYRQNAPFFGDPQNTVGGSLIDTPQNLEQFGRYIAAYVKGFERAAGTPIDLLSLQNEPMLNGLGYTSAVYTPPLYVKALKAVRSAFDAHNAAHPDDPILTKLGGPEDIGVGSQFNPSYLYRAWQYIDAIRADPEALDAIDYWVFHGWAGDIRDDGGRDGPASYQTFYDGRTTGTPSNPEFVWPGVGNDGNRFIITEESHEPNVWIGGTGTRYRGALQVSTLIADAINAGKATGYFYWQTDDNGGAPDEYSLTWNLKTDGPKYAAFKHYSAYVDTGAQVLPTTTSDSRMVTAAFLHPDDGTFTLVLTNLTTGARSTTVTLPDGFLYQAFEVYRSIEGSYHQRLADVFASSNGTLTISVPGDGIITLVGRARQVIPEPALGAALVLLSLAARPRRRGRRHRRAPGDTFQR